MPLRLPDRTQRRRLGLVLFGFDDRGKFGFVAFHVRGDWARVSIDLTEVAAARKIGVQDDRVTSWEAGHVNSTGRSFRPARRPTLPR
jgi:hypothetical protein